MSIFYFSPLFAVYMLALIFMIGACMGSFVNCIEWRIENKAGSIVGRSKCPKCEHKLSFFDLIPIFSYLFLRGKCHYCHEKISIRYFGAELAFGLSYAGILAGFGLTWQTLEYLILFTIILAAALSDIATFEVPDTLQVLAVLNFLAFLITHDDPLNRLLWGVVAGLVYGGAFLVISLIADKIYKKDTMGGADIKLIAVLGLYFGLKSMLMLLILSCIIGLILAFIFKAGWQREFPFIPAIVISAYICVFAAEPFIKWYLGLFKLHH